MKRIKFLLILLVFSSLTSVMSAQVAAESLLYVEPEKGGDVLIKSISHEAVGKDIF